ncbi:SLATT domain-containing protein [bacterium]|nr:SLATT domain-containing protein [bacterium]
MVDKKNTIQETVVSTTQKAVIKEAKRIEESALCTAKGHFAAAQFWANFHLWVGIPTAILATIASASALGQFDNHNIIAGILSIIVVALTALATFLNPNEKANVHLNSGNNYDAFQSRARIFWTIDCWEEESEQVLTSRLKDLSEQRDKLNRGSPQVPAWAYIIARKGIKEGEADYKVDKKG